MQKLHTSHIGKPVIIYIVWTVISNIHKDFGVFYICTLLIFTPKGAQGPPVHSNESVANIFNPSILLCTAGGKKRISGQIGNQGQVSVRSEKQLDSVTTDMKKVLLCFITIHEFTSKCIFNLDREKGFPKGPQGLSKQAKHQ